MNMSKAGATRDTQDTADKGGRVSEATTGGLQKAGGRNTRGRRIVRGRLGDSGMQRVSSEQAPRLEPSSLLRLIQIRLREHPEISFLKQVFLSERLEQEKGGRRVKASFGVSCFLITSLKAIP